MDYFYSRSTRGFYTAAHPLIPSDTVTVNEAQHAALMLGQTQGRQIVPDANGFPVLSDPQLTVQQRISAVEAAVQDHLDAQARARGYDDIRSAVTYAEEPAVPKFQAEGQALRAWRSMVWQRCYQILADFQAGIIPEPDAAGVIAMLPPAPEFT